MSTTRSYHVLSPKQVVWKLLLACFHALILVPTLLQDDVNYFVMFTDVLSRPRHQAVDNFTEEGYIAARILADSRHQLGNGSLVLVGRLRPNEEGR